MAHLLHIDSSIQFGQSASRALTARAAEQWRRAHPDGIVTYRDLGSQPIPHLVSASDPTNATVTEELVDEIKAADTLILGVPLYNFGPPSSVKAWVDRFAVAGVGFDPATGAGLLGGRELVVLTTRGGGYGPGTPREGWDHSEAWLTHMMSFLGFEPKIITTELTLANVNPAMAELKPLAAESLAQAHTAIDGLWPANRNAA